MHLVRAGEKEELKTNLHRCFGHYYPGKFGEIVLKKGSKYSYYFFITFSAAHPLPIYTLFDRNHYNVNSFWWCLDPFPSTNYSYSICPYAFGSRHNQKWRVKKSSLLNTSTSPSAVSHYYYQTNVFAQPSNWSETSLCPSECIAQTEHYFDLN